MKKTSGPLVSSSSQRKVTSDLHPGINSNNKNKRPTRSHPFLSYLKAAVSKVVGVFTILHVSRGKTTPGTVNHASKTSSHVRGISFSTDLLTGSNNSNSSLSRFKSSSSYGSSSIKSGIVGAVSFTIEEIYKATDNFSPANKIGEGCFGTVYKGKLGDGSLVAVKRAKKDTYDHSHLSSEFKNEVLTLCKIEHLNLVRLYGFVENGDEQILVVEYVGNGTLRDHLDGKRENTFDVAERLDIAIDVAHAITYLHMYTDRPIIHRDIKASNILITQKLRAKVADFGFARLATEDLNATHISTQIKGTTGYLDPEYVRTYQLTEKSDVYSFGVLLVELMTGRQPIDQNRPSKERVTVKWAMGRLKEGEAIFVMDPVLRRSPASNMAVEEVLILAYRCVAPSRKSRPSMKECAEVLWGIRKNFRERASSSSHASTSHQSANFPHRDRKKSRRSSFGIEDSDSYKFVSV